MNDRDGIAPAPAGTYHYRAVLVHLHEGRAIGRRSDGLGSAPAPEESVAVLTVQPPVDGEQVMVYALAEPARPGDASPPAAEVTTTAYSYADGQRRVVRWQPSQYDAPCAWAPPHLDLQLPLEPGARWLTESTAETVVDGLPARVVRTEQTEVVGADDGSHPILHRVITFDILAPGMSMTLRADQRETIDLDLGVPVRAVLRYSASMEGEVVRPTYDEVRLELAPAPTPPAAP